MNGIERENWPLKIKASWWKLALTCLFFIAACLVAILFSHSIFIKIGCVIGIIFFVWLYIRSLNLVRIYADETGITANSGGVFAKNPVGPIAWEDMIDLRLERVVAGRSTQYYLICDVIHPEKYIPADENDKRYRQLKNLQKCQGYRDESLIFKVLLNGTNINRKKALEILKEERARHNQPILDDSDRTSNQAKITQVNPRISRKWRLVLGLTGLLILFAWRFSGNQLGRSPLTIGDAYVVSAKADSQFIFAFDVNAHADSSYVGFHENATAAEVKKLANALYDSPEAGDKLEKSGLSAQDNAFDTEIKTSAIWASKYFITFKFADGKYDKLTDFQKNAQGKISTTLSNENGAKIKVLVSKQ